MNELIVALWHHMTSEILVNIGSSIGFLPIQLKTIIIWTNADLLTIRTLGTNFNDYLKFKYLSIQENAFQNVIWKCLPFCSGPNDIYCWLSARLQ